MVHRGGGVRRTGSMPIRQVCRVKYGLTRSGREDPASCKLHIRFHGGNGNKGGGSQSKALESKQFQFQLESKQSTLRLDELDKIQGGELFAYECRVAYTTGRVKTTEGESGRIGKGKDKGEKRNRGHG